jgi:hypothetical protein
MARALQVGELSVERFGRDVMLRALVSAAGREAITAGG